MKIFGQEKVKEQLDLIIPDLSLPLILFGPSGYGKTYLAQYIAEQTGKTFIEYNCAFIQNKASFIKTIIKATTDDLLFLDEIHALHKDLQELLYSVIDRHEVLLNRNKIQIEKFLLVAATTNEGDLNEALLNRFVYDIRLENYSEKDLADIAKNYASEKHSLSIEDDAAIELAKISRGCPRIVKKRVEWVNMLSTKTVSTEDVLKLKKVLRIDKHGLEQKDREYLSFLINNDGKPVSLKSICQKLNMDEKSIELIESYLIKRDLITKDSRGRSLNLTHYKQLINGK